MSPHTTSLDGNRLGVPSTQPGVTLVEKDLYGVLSGEDTMGFVHRAGRVFVALSGRNYPHSVEVGQCLCLEDAVRMVRHGHQSRS